MRYCSSFSVFNVSDGIIRILIRWLLYYKNISGFCVKNVDDIFLRIFQFRGINSLLRRWIQINFINKRKLTFFRKSFTNKIRFVIFRINNCSSVLIFGSIKVTRIAVNVLIIAVINNFRSVIFQIDEIRFCISCILTTNTIFLFCFSAEYPAKI